MKVVVVQGPLMMASQFGLVDVCIVPGGSGMVKYPCMLPVTPLLTRPGRAPSFVSHAPGLNPAVVTKLPSLNCSTTRNVPSGFVLTVKTRLNVSVAQSFPQVLESGELLGYGPECCVPLGSSRAERSATASNASA